MIIVTGASGLLGWHVVRALERTGQQAIGLWHTHPMHFTTAIALPLDLQESALVHLLVHSLRPSVVVHCAAWTDVDGCEQDPTRAFALNAEVPRRLASAAAEVGAAFVYVSTDMVFGENGVGPHPETETPQPINAYGRAKRQAETMVLHSHPKPLIVRTAFYGLHPWGKATHIDWILERLAAGERVPAFGDVVLSLIDASHLAEAMLDLLALGVGGIVHVAGREIHTNCGFAQRVAAYFGYPASLVELARLADQRLIAPRPHDRSLNVTRAEGLLDRPLPDLDAGLARYAQSLYTRVRGGS